MLYKEYALNLCGISFAERSRGFESIKKYAVNMQGERRVYIGSEFCSFFMRVFHMKLYDFINELLKLVNKITIVFPNVIEGDFPIVENIVAGMKEFEDVDEFVVNDFGTLHYLAKNDCKKKIVLGRLFSKNLRDPRIDLKNYKNINDKTIITNLVYNTPFYLELREKMQIKRMESDYISDYFIDNLFEELMVSIHYPYTYVTSGIVCVIGSMHKDQSDKFKLKNKCNFECTKYYNRVEHETFFNPVVHIGNAFFYKVHDNKLEYNENSNVRLVYNPFYSQEVNPK